MFSRFPALFWQVLFIKNKFPPKTKGILNKKIIF
jgi:hypothetical protein